MKKVLRTKKVLAVISLVLGIGVLTFFFNDIKTYSAVLYYKQINPRAGVVYFEKLYKDNHNGAEEALSEANFTVSETQRNAQDINTLFAYQEKIRALFSKREAHFVEMIRIDKEAKKLRVSKEYKEFFDKRMEADQNDYEAFKIYREGMQKLMDGTLSYYKFRNLFGDAARFVLVLATPDGFTPENVKRFSELSSGLNVQYNEIIFLAEKGIFTHELMVSMKSQNEVIKLFEQLNNAYVAGDKGRVDEINKKLSLYVESISQDESELITQWAKEKAKPIFEAQNEKHRKSLDLYNQAYIYAKNQKLDTILSVWNNKPPGTILDRKAI